MARADPGALSAPAPPPARRIARRLLVPALFAVLLAAVYSDPLATRRNFVGRDLVLYGLPLEKDVHDAWARGRLPAWSADISGGRPLFPNPNAGALYPLRPLLAGVPFPVAMRVLPVLHWLTCGVGMLALFEALGASAAAAWVAAVTYAFSGVMVSEVFYLPIAPAAALQPWFLWAVVRKARTARRKAVVLGVVAGLMFLVGDAFAAGIALAAALLWIGFEAEPGRRRAELAVLAGGLALGALFAAPQIVATLLLAPQTRRATMGIPLSETLRFTVSPWRLLELVVPYPFGEAWTLSASDAWSALAVKGYFVTLYAGAAAVAGLWAIGRRRARGGRFAVWLCAGGLALAMAGAAVPASARSMSSPIPLRFPEKFCVAAALALAVAAGLAVDRWRRDGTRAAGWIAVGVALSVAALAARTFPLSSGAAAARWLGAPPAAATSAGRQLPGALAEAGLLWAITALAVDGLRGAGPARLAACLALLTAVPVAANRRIARTEGEASVFAPTPFARVLARRDPEGAFRTLDLGAYAAGPLRPEAVAGDGALTETAREDWSYLTPTLWNRGTVFNVDPDRGDFSRLESLRRASALAVGGSLGPDFFPSLALRYALRDRRRAAVPGFRRFGGAAGRDWDENPSALPAVRLLERWREESGALPALAALPRLGPGEIVLETGRSASGAGAAGELRIAENSPERLVCEVSAPQPTWLFALRGYWPYRTITVDGREVEAAPAQLAFSAIPIAAGRHRVEWREEVPGIGLSWAGPALFALLAALLAMPRGALGAAAP